MALSWDYQDAERLVVQLSPPVCPQDAERALRRIYRAFAQELFREQREGAPAKQVRRELEALHKALGGLSPRAETALCDVLDDKLFLPHPYDQAQAVVNPCRRGVPATRLAPHIRLRALRLALDSVLEDLPRRRAGHPGKVSDATRRAMHVLCVLYCRCHAVAYPTWDFFEEEVRNPAALEFAFECLRAWHAPGIEDLGPDDVVRSLHNNRGGNQSL
jgi:hypothetical protein